MERFYRGVRNPWGQTSLSPNLSNLLTTYSRYCQTFFPIVRFGHYTCKTMVCQVLLCMNMPINFIWILSEFDQKIKETFIKIYKGLIKFQKSGEKVCLCFTTSGLVYLIYPLAKTARHGEKNQSFVMLFWPCGSGKRPSAALKTFFAEKSGVKEKNLDKPIV